MKNFAALIEALDSSGSSIEKTRELIRYFGASNEEDRLWAFYLLSGGRIKKNFTTSGFRELAVECSGISPWLFEECYSFAGDLAETVSLIMPSKASENEYSLKEIAEMISGKQEDAFNGIRQAWNSLEKNELFAFNKMITGGFRLGVSSKMIINALAEFENTSPDEIAYRLAGSWHPSRTSYDGLIRAHSAEDNPSKPYPFCLAYPLEGEPGILGGETEWSAEWKWDGIRALIIKRRGEYFIWSRGEELITEKFPELHDFCKGLPDGTAIDGEILGLKNARPLNFGALQRRIGRKRITKAILSEVPVAFISYDLPEFEGRDIRREHFAFRRSALESLMKAHGGKSAVLSELLVFSNWKELALLRSKSAEAGAEGLMLKRKTSPYHTGRKKGDWWKWKVDPMTVDAVMIYAQAGHGKRAGLFTDYTFGVWHGGSLVTVAKAYSGLSKTQIEEVDRFVKQNTVERFGPVRTVKQELVFELAFEGISESTRHKSGIALRFPRIRRWRKDKKAGEADTLESLKELLKRRESHPENDDDP